MTGNSETSERIAVEVLTDWVARAFQAARTTPQNAASVARALVAAEVDGLKGHGLARIESYTAQSAAGKIDGHAVPDLQVRCPGAIMVDAKNGFAYPAIDAACAALPDACAKTGVAAAAITRSNHAGAVGHHVEALAGAGLIALFFANTPKAMAPWGGQRPLFGTNPIAFAAPRRSGPPIIVDMALSEVARGKILNAAQKGEPIPEGWAVDADGNPTSDAKAALSGTLMPIGGAKGAALAMMVEILAVTIAGANLSTEATSFFEAEGAPSGVGQFMIAIDPEAFAGRSRVLDRIEAMAAGFEDNGSARLPGARRPDLRDTAARLGISVERQLLADIKRRASVDDT